ncbi:MAG: ATP-binding protein [Candidatus Moduliflexus flocculans]|nr:ATP-binding protein [Candidatus Moduliflexus flocculans]
MPARDPLRPDLVRRGRPQPPRQRLRRDARRAGPSAIRGYRRNRTEYVLSVRDTGQGISNPDKDQLFRPFFTTKEKGMGLGLPFIKRVMDTCGGKIEVQSRVGKGTIFRVDLQFPRKGAESMKRRSCSSRTRRPSACSTKRS